MRKLIELFNLETLEPNINTALQLGLKIIIYGAIVFLLLWLANMMLEPIVPQLERLAEYAMKSAKAICEILVFAFLLVAVYNVAKYY